MPAGIQTFNSINNPFPEVFLESLQGTFWNRVNSVEDLIPKMFKVSTTDRYSNTYGSFAGLPDFGTWDMESDISVESIDPRYKTTITQAGWRKAVAYTFKMGKYEKYDIASELADSLGYAAATTKQRYAYSFVNAQLAGTGTNQADGKQLFATDHPLATGAASHYQTGSSGTVGCNLITGALSHATLVQAIRYLYLTPDDMGNPMMFLPKYLIVPPDIVELAHVALKSAGKSGTANNDTNFLKDKYSGIEIVAVPWLSDSDGWILTSDQHKLVCEVSLPLSERMYFVDSSRANVHDAAFAMQVGAKDWRGVVGSRGA